MGGGAAVGKTTSPGLFTLMCVLMELSNLNRHKRVRGDGRAHVCQTACVCNACAEWVRDNACAEWIRDSM